MPAAAPAAPAAPAATPGASGPPPIDTDLYGAATEIDGLDDGSPPPDGGSPPPDKGKDKGTPQQGDPETPLLEDGRGPNPEDRDSDRETARKEIEALDDDHKPDPDAEKEKADKAREVERGKDGKFKTRDLKVVYEALKADHEKLTAAHTKLSSEAETLRRGSPDEIKTLSEKLTAAEARRNELEQELRHIHYERSPEFKTKYQQPLQEAWKGALADLNEITIENPDGTTRQATHDDLIEISRLPLSEARKRAIELFGVSADDMMAHRRRIRELTQQQQTALAKAKEEAGEREKTTMAEARKRAERSMQQWETETRTLATKFPRWYGHVAGDDEGNKVFDKGLSDVDRLYQGQEMTDEERIQLSAKIRFKAANHDRMALRISRLVKKVQKLAADLGAFEKSSPPGGKTGARTHAGNGGDWRAEADAEIDAMDDGQPAS